MKGVTSNALLSQWKHIHLQYRYAYLCRYTLPICFSYLVYICMYVYLLSHYSLCVQLSSFATSTPIKKDKENTRTSGHISPTYSESSEIKRPRLRDATHDVSSTELVGVSPNVCVHVL